MVDKHDNDPDAVAETLEIVGADVIRSLAEASKTHDVVITIHITPHGDAPDES